MDLIQLSDYFAPLISGGLLYYLLLFILFDSFGNLIREKIIFKGGNKQHRHIRIIDWLIGLSAFIFVWYLAMFFVVPAQKTLIFSLIIISLITLPSYIREEKLKKFLTIFFEEKIFIVILVFFLPAVFIKASLPPYYADEMAYHFVPPARLLDLKTWTFSPGVFGNAPRMMDVFYLLSFSLVRTYSVARLINFSILVSALLFSFKVLKKNLSLGSALLFVFIFFSLPQSIAFTSTLGYVDVPAYSFLLVGLMSALAYILGNKKEYLLLSAVFWGINLGTKYTGMAAFLPFVVLLLLFVNKLPKRKRKYLTKSFIFKAALLFIFFGGYWYLKNLIVFGNPIYPFIFPCYRFPETCQTGASFFGDWTTKINMSTLYPILKSLLPKNPLLHVAAVVAPIFAILGKNKKVLLLTSFLYLTVLLEFMLLSQMSGFLIRYHQHIQFFLILAISIQILGKYKNVYINGIFWSFYLALIASIFISFVHTVKVTNSFQTVKPQEIQYARGKWDIYDWVKYRLPNVVDLVEWCEHPPNNERTPIARYDPDLIWFSNDGFFRSFVTNCYYANPPLGGVELDQVLKVAKEKELKFWLVSNDGCLDDVKPKRETEKEYQTRLRYLNNILVCNSEQLTPNLYYFDYKNLDPRL